MNQLLAHLRRANAVLAELLDRLTRALQSKRRAQTVAVIAVALVITLVVAATMAGANRARSSWGSTMRVLMTTRVVEAGEPLTAENTALVASPLAMFPVDALDSLPNGATLNVDIEANTVITRSLISGGDESVDVPEDWRVVAMPIDVTAPNVVPGDTVDVVSTDSVLAPGAIVVSGATDTQGPSVAVPRDVAPLVATAAREGLASLVLAG